MAEDKLENNKDVAGAQDQELVRTFSSALKDTANFLEGSKKALAALEALTSKYPFLSNKIETSSSTTSDANNTSPSPIR